VDRVHGLWTGGAFGPPWTHEQSAARAHWRRGAPAFPCMGPHRGDVGSTSWWRGSDGQASAKGGGGGVSSTRRCSGREGEERRAKMSVVKMVGGVAPFYRVREAMEGSGGGRPARWVLIPIGF
jgi:hypothetical protein